MQKRSSPSAIKIIRNAFASFLTVSSVADWLVDYRFVLLLRLFSSSVSEPSFSVSVSFLPYRSIWLICSTSRSLSASLISKIFIFLLNRVTSVNRAAIATTHNQNKTDTTIRFACPVSNMNVQTYIRLLDTYFHSIGEIRYVLSAFSR